MAWFEYNAKYGDGHNLLYNEFPEHYVWQIETNDRGSKIVAIPIEITVNELVDGQQCQIMRRLMTTKI